jgi:hypothetical protein
MEEGPRDRWRFDVEPEAAVVTTVYVTKGGMPILLVTRELDDDEGSVWQFHCGNGDYRSEVLQLVRLDEILKLDPSVADVAALPIGFCARRNDRTDIWRSEAIE